MQRHQFDMTLNLTAFKLHTQYIYIIRCLSSMHHHTRIPRMPGFFLILSTISMLMSVCINKYLFLKKTWRGCKTKPSYLFSFKLSTLKGHVFTFCVTNVFYTNRKIIQSIVLVFCEHTFSYVDLICSAENLVFVKFTSTVFSVFRYFLYRLLIINKIN